METELAICKSQNEKFGNGMREMWQGRECEECDGNAGTGNQRGNAVNLCGNAKNVGNKGGNAGNQGGNSCILQ